jgi:hypothetical protein
MAWGTALPGSQIRAVRLKKGGTRRAKPPLLPPPATPRPRRLEGFRPGP